MIPLACITEFQYYRYLLLPGTVPHNTEPVKATWLHKIIWSATCSDAKCPCNRKTASSFWSTLLWLHCCMVMDKFYFQCYYHHQHYFVNWIHCCCNSVGGVIFTILCEWLTGLKVKINIVLAVFQSQYMAMVEKIWKIEQNMIKKMLVHLPQLLHNMHLIICNIMANHLAVLCRLSFASCTPDMHSICLGIEVGYVIGTSHSFSMIASCRFQCIKVLSVSTGRQGSTSKIWQTDIKLL